MKIAITAKGETLNDELDPHFGRAKKCILFDMETRAFTVSDNTQNLNAAQGAGIQSAQHIARLGAQAVITGNVGPKAFHTLGAAGIRIYLAPAGSVSGAIDAFEKKALEEASGATKEAHWI